MARGRCSSQNRLLWPFTTDMDMASARLLLDESIKKLSIDGRKKYIHVNSSLVKNTLREWRRENIEL